MAHQPTDQTTSAVTHTLDREWELIREGIAMVSSGASPRVVIASLRFGEQLLDSAQAAGERSHVRVVPTWSNDETASGVVIEPFTTAGND